MIVETFIVIHWTFNSLNEAESAKIISYMF